MERPIVVAARCSETERQALEAVAVFEQRGISETIREIIREAAQRRGLWPPDALGRSAQEVLKQSAA